MCGIAGFYHQNKFTSEDQLKAMTSSIAYRGPDDEGQFLLNFDNYQIGMGFRRLAILDLSPKGHQPMIFKNFVITFNGEIYNFKNIRKELQSYGYQFDSNSDTEVILKAFDKWGIDCINQFIGMFAFALFNRDTKELYLLRDRIGIKPLYYSVHDSGIVYASELKPLYAYPFFKKDLDFEQISYFLYHGYTSHGNSILKNVRKLLPGTWLKFANGKISVHTYWDIKSKYLEGKKSTINQKSEVIRQFDDLLTDSVKYRMISDVPLGSFLSGGYDSSLVTAIMQKLSPSPINTFTIGFEEDNYNEAKFAREVATALGTNHHEIYLSVSKAQELISQLPDYYDEPFGDSSALPTILVSRLAKNKATVILSGDGGDELFCGYSNYKSSLQFNRLKLLGKSLGLIQSQFNISQLLYNFNPKFGRYPFLDKNSHIINVNYLLSKHVIGDIFLTKNYTLDSKFDNLNGITPNIQEQHMIQDMLTYLPDDILTKVDRASMSTSLEVRVPILDHRIVEFSFKVPHNLKYKDDQSKILIKELAHRYVPKNLLDRPKKGFAIPITKWLKEELNPLLNYYVSEDFLQSQQVFNKSCVNMLLAKFKKPENEKVIGHYLWNFLTFQLWYDRYMK